jgi:dipeptidyl-peptidase-3
MWIKAGDDRDAVEALIDRYGVHFDPRLRDEVVARYKKLALPTYWAGVNPELTPTIVGDKVTAASISYPRDFIRQRLAYSAMYDPSLLAADKGTQTRAPARERERR